MLVKHDGREDHIYGTGDDRKVISVGEEQYEDNPVTLDADWRRFSAGIYRLESGLMVVLNVEPLPEFSSDPMLA